MIPLQKKANNKYHVNPLERSRLNWITELQMNVLSIQ